MIYAIVAILPLLVWLLWETNGLKINLRLGYTEGLMSSILQGLVACIVIEHLVEAFCPFDYEVTTA